METRSSFAVKGTQFRTVLPGLRRAHSQARAKRRKAEKARGRGARVSARETIPCFIFRGAKVQNPALQTMQSEIQRREPDHRRNCFAGQQDVDERNWESRVIIQL